MRGPGHAIHQPPGPVSARHAVQGSPARREWSRAVPSSKPLAQSHRSQPTADTPSHHAGQRATLFPHAQVMPDHTDTAHLARLTHHNADAAAVETLAGNTATDSNTAQ